MVSVSLSLTLINELRLPTVLAPKGGSAPLNPKGGSAPLNPQGGSAPLYPQGGYAPLHPHINIHTGNHKIRIADHKRTCKLTSPKHNFTSPKIN